MRTIYLVSVDGCGFAACGSLKKAKARVQQWLEGAQLDEGNSHAGVQCFVSDHGTAWIEPLPLE